MKIIETRISEKQFINRLEGLCRKKAYFDKGYNDKDTFVVKRKDNKFWLGKHYALIGRSDGYANDCLLCRYTVRENGLVSVHYRFGKRITYLIPFIISCALGIPIAISLIYDAIVYADPQWNGILIAVLFLALGLFGLLFRSKKERKLLEKHLFKICNINSSDIDENA